jgi:YbbR domain-containing protein
MVRVTLRGEANSIYPVMEDDIQAYVDLSRFDRPGNYQVAVQIRKLGTALDVSPLEIRIDPGEISLVLDHRISKFVPVTASFRGDVDPGFILNSHSLNPSQVIIDGPSRLVGNITELSTEIIDLGGRSQDFSMSVNILNRDPLLAVRGNGITEFRGSISRVVSVRNIQNVPVTITGLSSQFVYVPELRTVTLHLEGADQSELDNFVLPQDFLVIDCSAIQEPGTYMLQVRSDTVPNLILTFDPPEIMVQIFNQED